MVVLDSGDLVARDGRVPDGAQPAREAKGDLILRAVAHTGIDAMTVGDGELAFGLEWLTTRAEELQLPYVCANLQDKEGQPVFPATRVLEFDGLKVGVFGVTGNLEEDDAYFVTDATEAVTAAVVDLKNQGCHLIIGLSHLGVDDDVTLAEAVEGIDFLFAAHTRRRMEFPRVAGPAPTYVTLAGSRGRQVGRIRFTFAEDGRGFYDPSLADKVLQRKEKVDSRLASLEEQLAAAETDREKQRYERSLERTRANAEEMAVADVLAEGKHTMTVDVISLAKSLADDPEVKQMVAEAMSTMPEEPKRKGRQAIHQRSQMGEFSGGSQCRRCHPQAYQQWRKTDHANAYTTLVREQKHTDEKCFGCHITGFYGEGGPRKPSEVGYLRNVQCESCHGPSAKHVADAKVATPNKGKVSKSCSNCHTDQAHAGQATAFDLTAALEKVTCEDVPVEAAVSNAGDRRVPPPLAGGTTAGRPAPIRTVKPSTD